LDQLTQLEMQLAAQESIPLALPKLLTALLSDWDLASKVCSQLGKAH
jgi:hypothetical protein